jgi:WD40 repeat protein
VLVVYQEAAKGEPLSAVAWSPDGTRLVSPGKGPSDPSTAEVWAAASGKILLTLHDPTPDTAPGHLFSVAWSPDGRWIATAGFSFPHVSQLSSQRGPGTYATLQIWDATTGALVFTHRDTPSPMQTVSAIEMVSWSPDSKRVVTGDANSQARIWDIPSGRLLLTYNGHRSFVTAVGWSPDGKWVTSASSDTTAQVWDPQTGQTAYTYRGHTASIRALAWSPDSTLIATGGIDHTVQVWHAH